MKKFIPAAMGDCFELVNGVKIPCLGYGTWQTPGDVARESVKDALLAGYRHIDTAAAYGNEVEVGEGLKASGVKREEVFITTKHWVTERGYDKTIRAVEDSLKRLGLDYLDLYMTHWPCVELATPEWEDVNADTWRGIEKMYKDGKIRAIGVSNDQPKHLEALKKTAEIMPMVNQIEFHPGFTQMDNVLCCQEAGILVEAWSPLGSGAVLKDETLAAIAAKYNKSVAQLCVRFALQNGILPLPKSVNPGRMAQNTEVFDFEITQEDMAALFAMPMLGYSGFAPEEAPADKLAGIL